MVKRIHSKVINTGPFIERRVHQPDFLTNKYRRANDNPLKSNQIKHIDNYSTYNSSGILKDCNTNQVTGLFLDSYA